MIANDPSPASTGSFAEDVHLPEAARYELLDFIASELPRWRDHPDRPSATSETDLTDQLCDHLNTSARHSQGWSRLQFRTEVGDEFKKGRKIDLTIKPCGATIWIEGRRHSQFQIILPIECKRLPTPKEKDRDEREYVFSRYSTTGGIQRFKDGNHGGTHRLAAMVAYIQRGTMEEWYNLVSRWIAELRASGKADWSDLDDLSAVAADVANRTAQYRSVHCRKCGLPDLELRHLWIMMN